VAAVEAITILVAYAIVAGLARSVDGALLPSPISLVAGYRGLGVDYENNGFVFDVVQHGPILGAVFRL
jgi:hypothetical protein